MSLQEWPTVPDTDTNTTQLGGDWGNLISKLFTGIDIGSGTSLAPDINTDTVFRSSRLQVLDTGLDNTVKFAVPDNYSANRTLNFPTNTSWQGTTDTVATLAAVQTLDNKTLTNPVLNGAVTQPAVTTIYPNASNPLTIGRDQNSSNFALFFHQDNSAGTPTPMASFQIDVTSFTAGNETSDFRLRAVKAGAMTTHMFMNTTSGKVHFPGSGSTGIIFDFLTGLTSQRTFTFPNADTKLAGANTDNAFTVTQTFGSELWVIRAAQSSTAESIAKFTTSDSTNGSYIQIQNGVNTNAEFVPWIVAKNLDDAGHPALYFYGYIGNTHDSGTGAVIRFDVRKNDNSAISSRTLYSFRNAGTEILNISPTGYQLSTITSQSSTAEALAGWRLSDQAGGDAIYINNASGINGVFCPRIQAVNGTVSTVAGLTVLTSIDPTMDTGTVPAMLIMSNRVGGTNLSSRRLFAVYNNATQAFRINADSSMEQTMAGQDGLTMYRTTSTANSKVIINFNAQTSTSAETTYARIFGQIDDNTNGAHEGWFGVDAWKAGTLRSLFLTGWISANEAFIALYKAGFGSPAFRLQTDGLTGERVITFPDATCQLAGQNFANVFTATQTINAQLTVNRTAQASTGEVVAKFSVSDDASSFIQFKNQTGTDSEFIPQLYSFNNGTAANNGLRIISECNASQGDSSGNQGVLVFDSRKVGSVAFTARPIYDFQSAGTSVFKIDGNGNQTPKDGANMILGTTTGMKIGTATSQKLGFFNATPVTQRSAISSPAADVNALKTAVDALRQVLIDLGFTA